MKRPDNKEEQLEWIERYVLGKMSPDEVDYFESEAKKDPQLQKDMEDFQQTNQLIEEAFLEEGAISALKKLQSGDKQEEKSIPLFRYLSIAAAVSILFIAYLSISLPDFPDSENDFTVVRSTNSTSMLPGQRAVFDQFFEGQAHIVEGQYVLAVRNFEKVLESDDLRPYFKEAAQWHLIVAYLKSGDLSRAQQLYKQFDNCMDCEYHVSTVTRWKIWWQINWQKLG